MAASYAPRIRTPKGHPRPPALEDDPERLDVFRRIVDHSLDVLGEVDEEGRFVFVSPSMQPLLGYDPAALVGKPVVELMHPADTERIAADMAETMVSGDPVGGTYRLLHANGSERVFESWGRSYARNAGGRRAVFVSRDITARLVAERERDEALERLRTQEARLRSILDDSPHGLVLLDPEGGIEGWNRAAAQRARDVLGIEFAEGSSLLDLLPDPLRHRFARRLHSALEGVVSHSIEVEGPDGPVPLWLTMSPVRDDEGRTLGVLLSVCDLSPLHAHLVRGPGR